MNPTQLSGEILEAHIHGVKRISPYPGISLELQLGYTGLMARGAYEGYRKRWNTGRKKVGCFDFKIFDTTGDTDVPLVHMKVLKDALEHLDKRLIESVYIGVDPLTLSRNPEVVTTLGTVQHSMLEQEVNWGDEDFQSKTYFLPSKGLRPRDFIMAYLRRTLSEPEFLKTVEPKRAASGTWGVLRPPIEKEWVPFRESKSSDARPWLEGDLLVRYRSAADAMPDNPYYYEAQSEKRQGER